MISFDENEEYLCVELSRKNYLILSCMDSFELGEYGDFEGAEDCTISVFAMNLAVNKVFRARNITCSTVNLVLGDTACLDVSGKEGKSQSEICPGSEEGEDGEKGGDGGSIYFFAEQGAGIKPVMNLKADGGNGGFGQSGSQCKRGGKGGDGGDGGHICAVMMNPTADLMKESASLLEQTDTCRITDIWKQVDEAVWPAVILILKHCIKDQPKGDTCEDWMALVKDLWTKWDGKKRRTFLRDFVIQASSWGKQSAVALKQEFIHAVSGIPGKAGDGIVYGEPGKRGEAGTATVSFAASWQEMSEIAGYPALHPQLCQMILEKANALFMTADQKHSENYQRAFRLYQFLIRALEGMDQGTVPKCYKDHGCSLGMENVSDVFRRVRNCAFLSQKRLERGKDYYGSNEQYVPRLSFASYLKGLDGLLSSYNKTEQAWLSYRKKETKQENMRSCVLQSARDAAYSISHVKEEKDRILSRMADLSYKIAAMQRKIEEGKAAALSCLKQCEEYLRAAGGYTADDFVSALSILGFAPQSKVIMAGQVIDLVNKESNMLTTYDGAKLNKDYVINKAYCCCGKWEDLKEGVKRMSDGCVALEDPGADKLLADKEEIMSLFGKFYGEIRYNELKEKIESFCTLVLDRNQAVMEYNDYLVKALECDMKVMEEEENQKLGQKELLDKYSPTLPFIAGAMRRRYQMTQDNLLEEMYRADKALQYWSLSADSIMANSLSGLTREGWTYEAMKNVVEEMKRVRTDVMELRAQPKQEFKEDGSIVWEFSTEDLDEFWEQLKEDGAFEFDLSPADAHTLKKENPFSGMSEVRISKARPLIRGLKAKQNELFVDIIHTGRETFYNSRNIKLEFEHNMVMQSLRYREEKGNIHILEDSNLTLAEDGMAYAQMSPFARWRVALPKAPNEIMWKDCTRDGFQFCMEFWGTNGHFN